MAEPVTGEEFDELVDEVRGEKVVTRHILEQTRRNSDDLAVIKTRMARVEEKVDGIDGRVGRLEGKVDGLDARMGRLEGKFDGLVRDLPRIVGNTMREVLDERDRK
jgi:hypothetical protein